MASFVAHGHLCPMGLEPVWGVLVSPLGMRSPISRASPDQPVYTAGMHIYVPQAGILAGAGVPAPTEEELATHRAEIAEGSVLMTRCQEAYRTARPTNIDQPGGEPLPDNTPPLLADWPAMHPARKKWPTPQRNCLGERTT